jgi:hypothetical protein
MRKQLLLASSVAILLTCPALAQDTAGTTDQTASTEARSPRDVTCREITALDTATVPGVLYFISGFKEGERSVSGMRSSDASGSTTGTDMNQAANAAGSTDTSGTNSTANSSTTETATAPTADTDSAAGTDMAVSDSTAQETTGATPGSSASTGTDASVSGSGSTAMVSSIQGYFDIPIEQTMVACSSEPDSKASDVLERNRGSNGSSGSGEGSGSAQ